jgi:hypothetical protein
MCILTPAAFADMFLRKSVSYESKMSKSIPSAVMRVAFECAILQEFDKAHLRAIGTTTEGYTYLELR